MRFSTYYLQEKVLHKNVLDLKNIVAGVAKKDIPTERDVNGGVEFVITDLGSWSLFKQTLTEILLEKKWQNFSKESNELNFRNSDYSLWITYDGSDAKFFLTDDKNFIPNSEQDNESK